MLSLTPSLFPTCVDTIQNVIRIGQEFTRFHLIKVMETFDPLDASKPEVRR